MVMKGQAVIQLSTAQVTVKRPDIVGGPEVFRERMQTQNRHIADVAHFADCAVVPQPEVVLPRHTHLLTLRDGRSGIGHGSGF